MIYTPPVVPACALLFGILLPDMIPCMAVPTTGSPPPDLVIRAIPSGPLDPFRVSFSKYINVFGVHVLATEKTPDTKMLHVATVLAEYLDNDEDGSPDNPLVADALVAHDAYLAMAPDERSFEKLEYEQWLDAGFHAGQGVWGEETNPANGRFDASLEEVLHLITHYGYAHVYPEIFGERPGTEVADCLDRARGGRFMRVPRRYPPEAWFRYDDRTCDYGCQVTEYVYWALTSLLGAQADPARCNEIRHEWKLCTPEQVAAQDPWICELLRDPRYAFPSVLPDGTYRIRKPRTDDSQSDSKE